MNEIFNIDCMEYMKTMTANSVDLTLTDIPYGEVNRKDNGLNNLNKGNADIVTFSLKEFLDEVYRITKSTIIIFCGRGQLSDISKYFDEKQKQNKGTPRQLIWRKTNPSPMNGQYVYLSGIENAMWFKKRGGTFNAHCKNTVFDYPLGTSKLHPTEKNHKLLKELILDNSNEGDVVFDPCAGSGAHLLVAKENNRNYLGCEIFEDYYKICKDRGL
jgi:DNA modification methylase